MTGYPESSPEYLTRQANEIRKKIIRMVAAANSSHVGSALSIVEMLVVLYFRVMNFKVDDPDWADRDRFILSKGHGCTALYATLAAKGFFPETVLDRYYLDGGKLAGHPVKDSAPGIEASTGSLGHGLSIGIGMALAARRDHRDYRVFVLLGDGECNEGSVWEAAMCAAHHRLNNLVIIVDHNKLQGLGRTDEIVSMQSLADKWQSFGCGVREADGHNIKELLALSDLLPFESNLPSVIIAHTVKGKGVSFMEDQLAWHYKSPNQEQLEKALKELELP
jgi:transketolase